LRVMLLRPVENTLLDKQYTNSGFRLVLHVQIVYFVVFKEYLAMVVTNTVIHPFLVWICFVLLTPDLILLQNFWFLKCSSLVHSFSFSFSVYLIHLFVFHFGCLFIPYWFNFKFIYYGLCDGIAFRIYDRL